MEQLQDNLEEYDRIQTQMGKQNGDCDRVIAIMCDFQPFSQLSAGPLQGGRGLKTVCL